jgi:crossover junction endodeoxyribonuclease RuvC
MSTVVGIDLSLTSTGLAAVHPDGATYVSRVVSKGSTKDSLAERHRRLLTIGSQVLGFVHQLDAGLVVIEAPSFASKYGHPHDRSGLWWMVANQVLAHGIPLAAAPPTCRAKYATGKGNAPKDRVLTDVVRRYPEVMVSKNDEADALVLAAMGARHLGRPIEDSLPLTHLAGMAGVEWPTSHVTDVQQIDPNG